LIDRSEYGNAQSLNLQFYFYWKPWMEKCSHLFLIWRSSICLISVFSLFFTQMLWADNWYWWNRFVLQTLKGNIEH
jgi:hypothetical protein